MKKTFLIVIVNILSIIYLQAQDAVVSTGGDASGSGGTAAYSVGQVIYTTNTSSSGTISEGVQQAYEIYSVGIIETKLNFSLLIFPNPTNNNITLQIQDYNNEKLTYHLFDVQGKLLINKAIISNQTQINMSDLPSATYFINVVSQENKKVQSFKIIKN